MMKINYRLLYFIAFAVTLGINARSQPGDNDLQKFKLNGPVKSITENCFEATELNGRLTKGKMAYREFEYNSLITFNEQGNILEENLIEYTGAPYLKYIFHYDDHNRLSIKQSYRKGNLPDTYCLYFYNEDGNLVEERTYSHDSTLLTKSAFQYAQYGTTIEEFRDLESRLHLNYTTRYDNSGKIIEKIESNWGWEDYLTKLVYGYDDKGRLTLVDTYKSDEGLSQKKTMVYDAKGNVTEITERFYIYDHNTKNTFQYDEWNNVAEEIKYRGDGSVEYQKGYRYVYDDHGNWVVRVDYKNRIPVYINEREIIYY